MVMYEYRTEICQDFASAKNIKLEIRGLPELFMDPQFVTIRPSKKGFFLQSKKAIPKELTIVCCLSCMQDNHK